LLNCSSVFFGPSALASPVERHRFAVVQAVVAAPIGRRGDRRMMSLEWCAAIDSRAC
jgi:hypothetical protein